MKEDAHLAQGVRELAPRRNHSRFDEVVARPAFHHDALERVFGEAGEPLTLFEGVQRAEIERVLIRHPIALLLRDARSEPEFRFDVRASRFSTEHQHRRHLERLAEDDLILIILRCLGHNRVGRSNLTLDALRILGASDQRIGSLEHAIEHVQKSCGGGRLVRCETLIEVGFCQINGEIIERDASGVQSPRNHRTCDVGGNRQIRLGISRGLRLDRDEVAHGVGSFWLARSLLRSWIRKRVLS